MPNHNRHRFRLSLWRCVSGEKGVRIELITTRTFISFVFHPRFRNCIDLRMVDSIMMDDSRLTLCIKIQRKAVLAFHDLSAVVDPIDVLEAGFLCRHAAPTHTTAPCWWNTRERV